MRTVKAVLIFFICGLVSGLCFGTLLSLRSLRTFWFIEGDKLLIPTYRYYLGVGVFLVLGLASADAILRGTDLLIENGSTVRKVVSAIIVAISPVMLFATATFFLTHTATITTETGTILTTNIDPITVYVLGIIAFGLMLSLASWVLTGRRFSVGLSLNLITLPVAFCLVYIAAKVLRVPGEWSELVTYTIYFSLISASWGLSIAASKQAAI